MCICVCVRACVRACVHACVHTRVRMCDIPSAGLPAYEANEDYRTEPHPVRPDRPSSTPGKRVGSGRRPRRKQATKPISFDDYHALWKGIATSVTTYRQPNMCRCGFVPIRLYTFKWTCFTSCTAPRPRRSPQNCSPSSNWYGDDSRREVSGMVCTEKSAYTGHLGASTSRPL